VIAHFILTVAQLVLRFWKRGPDIDELKDRVMKEVKIPRTIKPEMANKIIKATLNVMQKNS